MANEQSEAGLISCLMAHLPTAERAGYLRESLERFDAQTYANRELVVALDEGPLRGDAEEFLRSLNRSDVRVLIPEKKLNLGALRNYLWDNARGQYICTWDDDDNYGKDRLAKPLAFLQETGADAVYLQDHYHFFPQQRELYWLSWRATDSKCMQQTVLARRDMKSRYPTEGREALGEGVGEDHMLLEALVEEGSVKFLGDAPELFVYIHHGTNVRDIEHHRMLAETLSISARLAQRRQERIAADVAALGLGPLTVLGSNGVAFDLS